MSARTFLALVLAAALTSCASRLGVSGSASEDDGYDDGYPPVEAPANGPDADAPAPGDGDGPWDEPPFGTPPPVIAPGQPPAAPQYVWAVPPCGPPPCGPTCPPAPCELPPCGYAGVFFDLWPGIGGGMEFGRVFRRTHAMDLSWEVRGSYQDLWAKIDDEKAGGKYMSASVGLKASLNPNSSHHPVGRVGLGWVQITGNPSVIDFAEIPGADDYFGGYVGVGWEFDLGPGMRTGPEAGVFGGFGLSDADFAVIPTFRWRVIFDL